MISTMDGLEFSVLTPLRASEAFDVICEGFVDEPVYAWLTPLSRAERFPEIRAFSQHFTDECAQNGLSIMCSDPTANNKIAGVFWVRDFKAPLPSDFDENVWESGKCPSFSKLIDVVLEVDTAYENVRKKRGLAPLREGECIDLWMLAVRPEYRGRRIATTMTELALQRAIAQPGVTTVVVECTNGLSASCARKCGMKEVVAVEYAKAQQTAFADMAKHTSLSHFRFFEYCTPLGASSGNGSLNQACTLHPGKVMEPSVAA